MAKSVFNKEQTKIRRKINRQRRHVAKKILKKTSDETEVPTFRKTEGWESWQYSIFIAKKGKLGVELKE